MATPLDIGLLKNFQIIFPFLFIWAITYALLTKVNFLGDNRALHATMATVIAFMALFSDVVIATINVAAPWFVLMIVFIVFLLLGFMILGIGEADIVGVLRNPSYSWVNYWILALVIIIVLGSLSSVMSAKKGGYPPFSSEDANETAGSANGNIPETQESDFWATLFHPKVLGLSAIMLIAFFTVSRLTGKS